MATVTFQTKEHPFFDELKSRVDAYFEKNQLSHWGNWKIYLKTAILLSSAVATYTWLVFFTPGALLGLFGCAFLGLTLAGIGFNVMHDGAHGSYSRFTWLNDMMGYSLNLMGGDMHLWKAKHNMIHHSFTNVEGMDDDIDIQPWMRLSEHQKLYKMHRFQHIYAFIFYSLNYLLWVFYFDFKKYFSGKIGGTKIRKYTTSQHIIFWATKIVYLFVFLALPMIMTGVGATLLGYSVLMIVCGVVIAIVFQLAHVVEGASFHEVESTNGNLDVEWAVHQINTTSNFATRSSAMLWLTGGLNHQVEHHLFPRISHVHYPAINKIVRETCEKFGVRYNEHKTVLKAIRSHIVHLRNIGRK